MSSRLVELFSGCLLGLEIRGNKLQDVDDMIRKGGFRHPVARRRPCPGEFDPLPDDGGLVLPDEVRQP